MVPLTLFRLARFGAVPYLMGMQTVQTKWFTFPVAAVAYGKLATINAALTHSFDPTGERVLCGKVKASNILDDYTFDTEAAPTCTVCAKRLAKLAKVGA